MSIFSRMTDIVNSNINAILDKAEDPEKMVRLIVQEMEEALVEVRSTSARIIADRKELLRRLEWQRADAHEWERKAEVAVRNGRDDLAKGALLEGSRGQALTDSLTKEVALLDDTLHKLNLDIGTLQEKIIDAKARQNAIVLRGQAAHSRLGMRKKLHESGVDDAIQQFELYERKMDDLEGLIEAYDLGQKSLSDEICALETGDDVEVLLNDLKSRLSGGRAPQSAKAAEDNASKKPVVSPAGDAEAESKQGSSSSDKQ
jgi:phage shock protein A